MEGISEVSWSSLNAAMAIEESELMAQLLGPYSFSSEQDQDQDQDLSLGIQSLFWSDHVTDTHYSSQDANSSLCYWPQENNSNNVSTSSFFAPSLGYQECCYMSESNVVPAINHGEIVFKMVEGAMTVPSSSFGYLNETSSEDAGDSAVNSSEQVVALEQKPQHKRKFSMDEVTKPTENENKFTVATDTSKKAKVSSSQVPKCAKIMKPKKTQKSNASCEEEESNAAAALNVQSSSSCSSEDNSNASQELNGGSTSSSPKGLASLNLNGKARASRGSATDPQSLYARKRRERINERLRILQNLVPNGTKVDISTMLEDAVQYVKFLQLQIKLLSSDDLWMYAPLAYNGMDMGLDLKISPPRQ